MRPFPGPGGKWQISTDGGNTPLWSPNGKELYFVAGGPTTGSMMAAAVEAGPSFKHAIPRPLYVLRMPLASSYSIAADGQRFLVVQGSEETAANEVVVGLNWADELKGK